MRAVFLDLNGTLVMPVKVGHPTEYMLLPGAGEAIRLLNQHGFICPVITVQSRISMGIFSLGAFDSWFRPFQRELRQQGAEIVGPYLCPHQSRDACKCKKPQTALYRQAAANHDIQLTRSVVVGNTLADLFAARSLGCASCLVRTGWGEQALRERNAAGAATYVAADILDAARWIVETQIGDGAANTWPS
jgi:D-glycero-D-manno-heptose 1,7-bisphosphate phosphatase